MSTILFIEDEHAWRAVFGELLRNEGFLVLEGSDIGEAVHACREISEPIDLSIIDVKLGTQLAARLAPRYPHMRVLFIGDAEHMTGAVAPGLKYRYLRKPFTSLALLKSVRSLIPSGVPA